MSRFITVFDDTPKFSVRKREIHKLIKELSREFNFKIEMLDIFFIPSEEMIELNNQYLKHNYDTDILTFDYSVSKDLISADIFISYKMAEENAKKYKVDFNNEIIRLIIHGILHIIGYDDKTPSEKRKMKRKENELTKKYSYFEILK